MTSYKPDRGVGTQVVGLLVLAAMAYVVWRLLHWLFPQELRWLWHSIASRF